MKDITSEFWQYIENNRGKKRFDRIYNWLNRDNLSEIIVDNNVFWIELTCPSTNSLPNVVYDFIKKWAKKQGLIPLYDVPIS